MKNIQWLAPLLLLTYSCDGQTGKHYVIAEKNGSLKQYTKHGVKLQQLQILNPRIKNDSVHAKDTVYLMPPAYEEMRISELLKRARFNGKEYLVCEVDPRQYKIEAFNRKQGKGEYTFARLAGEKKEELVFAMNGGMYEKDLTPAGLFVAEGVSYHPVNVKKEGNGNLYMQPNGVFFIDSNDQAFVVPTDQYLLQKAKIKLATQSGPMLIINKTYHHEFTEGSANLNIRNGVGVNRNKKVVFVIAQDPVNFYEFARLFKEKLYCDNALYLDGAVSQCYIPGFNQPTKQFDLGVFLTVSRKEKAEVKKASPQPKAVMPRKTNKP